MGFRFWNTFTELFCVWLLYQCTITYTELHRILPLQKLSNSIIGFIFFQVLAQNHHRIWNINRNRFIYTPFLPIRTDLAVFRVLILSPYSCCLPLKIWCVCNVSNTYSKLVSFMVEYTLFDENKWCVHVHKWYILCTVRHHIDTHTHNYKYNYGLVWTIPYRWARVLVQLWLCAHFPNVEYHVFIFVHTIIMLCVFFCWKARKLN